MLQPSSTTNYYSLHPQKPYFGLASWFVQGQMVALSRGRCTNLIFYLRDCKQILKSMNKGMYSLTTAHIYGQPGWPSIYICETSRLHIVYFLVLKSIYDIVRGLCFCAHWRVAIVCVPTGTLNFETLKKDFNQNVWLQLLPSTIL